MAPKAAELREFAGGSGGSGSSGGGLFVPKPHICSVPNALVSWESHMLALLLFLVADVFFSSGAVFGFELTGHVLEVFAG